MDETEEWSGAAGGAWGDESSTSDTEDDLLDASAAAASQSKGKKAAQGAKKPTGSGKKPETAQLTPPLTAASAVRNPSRSGGKQQQRTPTPPAAPQLSAVVTRFAASDSTPWTAAMRPVCLLAPPRCAETPSASMLADALGAEEAVVWRKMLCHLLTRQSCRFRENGSADMELLHPTSPCREQMLQEVLRATAATPLPSARRHGETIGADTAAKWLNMASRFTHRETADVLYGFADSRSVALPAFLRHSDQHLFMTPDGRQWTPIAALQAAVELHAGSKDLLLFTKDTTDNSMDESSESLFSRENEMFLICMLLCFVASGLSTGEAVSLHGRTWTPRQLHRLALTHASHRGEVLFGCASRMGTGERIELPDGRRPTSRELLLRAIELMPHCSASYATLAQTLTCAEHIPLPGRPPSQTFTGKQLSLEAISLDSANGLAFNGLCRFTLPTAVVTLPANFTCHRCYCAITRRPYSTTASGDGTNASSSSATTTNAPAPGSGTSSTTPAKAPQKAKATTPPPASPPHVGKIHQQPHPNGNLVSGMTVLTPGHRLEKTRKATRRELAVYGVELESSASFSYLDLAALCGTAATLSDGSRVHVKDILQFALDLYPSLVNIICHVATSLFGLPPSEANVMLVDRLQSMQELCLAAIRLNPHNAAVYHSLAGLYVGDEPIDLGGGVSSTPLELCAKAIEVHPGADALAALAVFLSKKGPSEEVLLEGKKVRSKELLERAVALEPHDPFVFEYLASHLQDEESATIDGVPMRRRELQRHAVSLDPCNVDTLVAIAATLGPGELFVMPDRRRLTARELLLEGLRVDPSHAMALSHLAVSLEGPHEQVESASGRVYTPRRSCAWMHSESHRTQPCHSSRSQKSYNPASASPSAETVRR